MTTPDDTSGPSGSEQTPRFAFLTPGGLVESADDLPPGVREAFLAQLNSLGLPEGVRTLIADELTKTDDSKIAPESLDIAAANEHREQLWDLLDRAFPNDPHLWSAAQALLDASALNPRAASDQTRLHALETAQLHLERHSALLAPPMSPADQMVARFVRKMDGL